MLKKIAILGGGITGLTAAHDAINKGHKVTIYEKAPILGGLAAGFKVKGWEWPLEYAYHHIFANDTDIQEFATDIGYNDIFFRAPHTDSLYFTDGEYKTFPVDTPADFLQFPLLSFPAKLRGAIGLAVLKALPHFSYYNNVSAEFFVEKYMGKEMWDVFFKELFRKKYGKYAGNILAAFLWARIHKRTKNLGYMKGGFQAFIDHCEVVNKGLGVVIHKNYEIHNISKSNKGFKIDDEWYDVVISTLPSPVLAVIAKEILPQQQIAKLKKLKYLDARVLVLETDEPLLKSTYWLNVCTEKVPLMLVAQHTNFIDKSHYNNHHLAYVGYYLERDDPKMTLTKEAFVQDVQGALNKCITTKYSVINTYDFIGRFAQPIFDHDFILNKPDFCTPVKNFYIANLDMTYPYDRGTNFAVRLGREVIDRLSG